MGDASIHFLIHLFIFTSESHTPVTSFQFFFYDIQRDFIQNQKT